MSLGEPFHRAAGRRRAIGYQYPHSIVVGDSVWLIYAISKEDIELARIPLTELTAAAAARPTPCGPTEVAGPPPPDLAGTPRCQMRDVPDAMGYSVRSRSHRSTECRDRQTGETMAGLGIRSCPTGRGLQLGRAH